VTLWFNCDKNEALENIYKKKKKGKKGENKNENFCC
jgi:hypothetical protein